ncbi:hypothetical protein [Clostridium chromiireducens]|uniref:Uncharacterized protein n=1 Tax=Clostridium chromiireducens TaxID=225345 RepID=A0A1V4IZL7_9CLOT|nr:hypothetical protein [Clostridium chromiireducens]OPJ65511.1 hypothetical protein CLCHR_07030 [Clostridium chromiireducens]
MYVIERGKSAWLCVSAVETYEVQAVQIRLQAEDKDFKVFEQRLDKGEIIDAGVIKCYKCSDANKCNLCTKYKGCEILKAVQETAQASSDFAKFIKDNGGYTF